MAMKTFNVGDVLGASDTNEYLVNTKYVSKPNGTDRTSTTLAVDPDLVMPVDANKVYDLQLRLILRSPAAAGFQFQWAFPSGTAFYGLVEMHKTDPSGVVVTPVTYDNNDVLTGQVVIGPTSGIGIPDIMIATGTVDTAGAGGNFSVKWAQIVASGTTTVCGGSSMTMRRVS